MNHSLAGFFTGYMEKKTGLQDHIACYRFQCVDYIKDIMTNIPVKVF